MRYLSHAVLHAGKVYRQSLVEITDGIVRIERFTDEVHSTVFVSGIIAIVARDRITDSQLSRLDHIVKDAPLVEMAIKRAMRYLLSLNLFPDEEEAPRIVTIQR